MQERAKWLRLWSRQFLRILHVEVTQEGAPPERGILASNHLSYVDILALGSLHQFVFVSKSEVASWPVVGPVTKLAGTLYVNRQQKSDVVRLGEETERVVNAGVVVVLFLEGTSSDGSEVLPFRSSLLAPAEAHGWPVTGAWIHYEVEDGIAGEDVCYWGDMTFGPHFFKLMRKRRIKARVKFGSALSNAADRKEMAREAHAQVCRLKEEHERASGGPREPAESQGRSG